MTPQRNIETDAELSAKKACLSLAGSYGRWAQLREIGATDKELRAAIAREFGDMGGGAVNAEIFVNMRGGSNPSLEFFYWDSDCDKHTFTGDALLRLVRRAMGVPLPVSAAQGLLFDV